MLTVRNARRILIDRDTERDGDLCSAQGHVLADGAPTAADSPGELIDATGCVITPGLINAHHHLLQSAFRTLPETRGIPMTQWLSRMGQAYVQAGIDPDLCERAAAVGIAESLLCGVTTVADHHLTWPADASTETTVEMVRAASSAAYGLGGRLSLVRGSARDDPGQAARSVRAIAEAMLPANPGTSAPGTTADGMFQLAVGPAGVHSDGETTFRLLGEVAGEFGLRRRTQSNEQVDVAVVAEKYGCRPLDLLERWEWLAEDVTLAHLCDITTDEIERLAAHGVTATHAPGCDVPMGWGIAPVAELQEAGVDVGLGTSGGGSNDAGHLLADARLAMQVSALRGPQLDARDVLQMATEGGATGLCRPELGHLRAGAAADFCVWDVSGAADAGVADPAAGLLWASPGRRPRDVVVGGELVVSNFQLVRRDEQELTARMHERMGR